MEQKPNLLDRSARAGYDTETKRLAAWGMDLTAREAGHKFTVEQLNAKLQTPEALSKIARIKEAVLEKNRPLREELEGLENHIQFLREEKKEITLEKTKLELGMDKGMTTGPAYKAPDRAMNKLERAVNQLETVPRALVGG